MTIRISFAALTITLGAHGAVAAPDPEPEGGGYRQVHSFQSSEGRRPMGALYVDDGNVLFGTTADGGSQGLGTLYKLTIRSDLLKTVHDFGGDTYAGGGSHPLGGVSSTSGKRLFTTSSEPPSRVYDTNADGSHGGTTMKLDPEVIGWSVTGALVIAPDARMWGTAEAGGESGHGTVFWVTFSGVQHLVHSFTGTDGNQPHGAVLRTPDGRIIGATRWGGTYGLGTIFEITGQENFASLHSFSPDECSSPMGELVEIAGDLYGVCSKGGPNGGGAAFRLAANGKLTLLHAFGGPPKGAARPLAGLTAGATPDVLYGTTSEGGKHGVGTVFRMTLDGDVKILHSFCNCDGDGYLPAAPLALGSRGELYGTTTAGGAIDDSGTVFELATP